MNKKFHGEFDPEFDKLPDQPVTIGGDKSAAAWHGKQDRAAAWADGYQAGFERGVIVANGKATGGPPINPFLS